MTGDKIVIAFMGDVMIGRGVDKMITCNGYSYPWGDMLPLLRQSDIRIINLETTLTTSEKIVDKVFNFKATPDKVKALTEAAVTIASLANNHILDYSEEGMFDTIKMLNDAGIKYAGAGASLREASQPVVYRYRNLRMGLFSYTDNERGWKAGDRESGINYIDIDDERDRSRVIEDIQALQKDVDPLVISIHWGPNMREYPSSAFINFAHKMIDAGADIIHGHSAHIFQGIEVYGGKVILYDTGDFIDDYRVYPDVLNDHSFLYLVELLDNRISRLQLVPVVISHYQVNKATGKDYEWCLVRMRTLSSRFRTRISMEGDVQLKP